MWFSGSLALLIIWINSRLQGQNLISQAAKATGALAEVGGVAHGGRWEWGNLEQRAVPLRTRHIQVTALGGGAIGGRGWKGKA